MTLPIPISVPKAVMTIESAVGITVQEINALTIANPAPIHIFDKTAHSDGGSIARPPIKPARKKNMVAP